jgi:DNA-3-methyladenine glycosylase II
MTKIYQPIGPFDLLYQNRFFNGWPVIGDDTIVMAFPVEGWEESAAVTVRQQVDGSLEFCIYGAKNNAEQAFKQALAALSLDENGDGWPEVGTHDSVIGELQQQYHFMRPTLFHSPYEATCSFMIGHRISIAQARKLRQQLAEQYGQRFTISGQDFFAFPGPQALLDISGHPSLNSTKIERLHGAAQAALDGWLDRQYLRNLDEAAALTKLETLAGVGSFFSQGILNRAVGNTDGFTHDDITYHAIKLRYGLGDEPTKDQVLEIAEQWRPFRMWAVVLMHVWVRQSGNIPERTFSKR